MTKYPKGSGSRKKKSQKKKKGVGSVRRFGKESYTLKYSSDRKTSAKRVAKDVRGSGWNARVVPGRSPISGEKGFWHVYEKPKNA